MDLVVPVDHRDDMHEKTMESLVLRHYAEIWPEWGLTLRSTQVPLDAGRLDLLFAGVDGMRVMELKRDVITASTIDQLQRYVLELRRRDPDTTYGGIAVAPSVSPAGASRAEELALLAVELPEARLREVAARHGIALDAATGHRPRPPGRIRTARPVPRTTRGATDPVRAALLARVDARFPPGSLTATSASAWLLREYCSLAFPSSTPALNRIAAQLLEQVLDVVPGSAVGRRAADGWTTIDTAEGVTAFAIEPKRTTIKTSFSLPTDVAAREKAAGRITVKGPRHYGMWVHASLSEQSQIPGVMELVKKGLTQA